MAQHFSDVPKDKQYDDKELHKIISRLAPIIYGKGDGPKDVLFLREFTSYYKGAIQLVEACHKHRKCIKKLMDKTFEIPEGGASTYESYKSLLESMGETLNELHELEKARVVVRGLVSMSEDEFEYILKLDPGKLKGSAQQKRVNEARGVHEIQKKNQISLERGVTKYKQ